MYEKTEVQRAHATCPRLLGWHGICRAGFGTYLSAHQRLSPKTTGSIPHASSSQKPSLLKRSTAAEKTNPLLLAILKRHPQVNDVTRRFRARPTINLLVTNNIGRLRWPPAQLSGHLDFFQNKCGSCKYRSAGLQEIGVQIKQHLERFFFPKVLLQRAGGRIT